MKASAHSSDNALAQWYQNEPGRTLAHMEHKVLNSMLFSLPGLHVIQAGALDGTPIRLQRARATYCHLALDQNNTQYGNVCADSNAFPLRTGMADIVLLLHSLEFAPTPYRLLCEAERVLRPDGHLIVLGFNPISLFGLTHTLRLSGSDVLDRGEFFTRGQLKDWCAMLNLEIVEEHSGGYGLPYTFLPWLSNYFFSWGGAFYALLIRKRLFPLTPIGVKHRRGMDELIPKAISTSRTFSND